MKRALRASATVAGSPQDVYDLIANAGARAQWLPELEVADGLDRPLEKGDHFDGRSTLLLHRFYGSSEVVEAESGAALEERVVIGAMLRTRWEVEPLPDGGSRVTHVVEVDFPAGPLGGLARLLLGWRLARLQRQGLARLRDAV